MSLSHGTIGNIYEIKKLLRLFFPNLGEEDIKDIIKLLMEKLDAKS